MLVGQPVIFTLHGGTISLSIFFTTKIGGSSYSVIYLQFLGYGSLGLTPMGPAANLWVLTTIFHGKSAKSLHPGTHQN